MNSKYFERIIYEIMEVISQYLSGRAEKDLIQNSDHPP
jgi:hypothetical protein